MGMIKAIVVGMAGLILVGVLVIGWGLAHHWTGLLSHQSAAAPSAAVEPVPSAPIQTSVAAAVAATVAPPEGMHFVQMETAGGLLVLRFAGPAGQRIETIDPRTGRIAATIAVPDASQ